MVPSGSQWLQWLLVVSSGSHELPLIPNGSQFPVVLNGYSGYQWLSTVNYQWFPVITSGSQ